MNSGSLIQDALTAIRDCALQMLENASYIQKELPGIDIPDQLRLKADEVYNSLIETKHDVISEVFEIDELIESRADKTVVVPRLIRCAVWMREDILKFHKLVMALQEASQQDNRYSLALLLVQESGMNILNAFSQAQTAIRSVIDETEK